MSLKRCSESVRQLRTEGHVTCLNPRASSGRVHWLTCSGIHHQTSLCRIMDVDPPVHFLPEVDWALYGSICFSHRSMVVRHLQGPMQAVQIKRRAYFHDPSMRMSANNARDVIRYLLSKGIIERVPVRGRRHPCYDFTPAGKPYQLLLAKARERPWLI